MVTRQAILDFRTTGDAQATSNVVRLADALEQQRKHADRIPASLKRASDQTGTLGAVSQSATAKITSLTNTIGPLGAGLGHISRAAPQAALGILQVATASERASAMTRLLNTTVIAGTSAMLAGGVAMAAMADDAIRAGDTYATLHARIRTFSEGAIQAAQVERALYENARDARAAVEGQVTLYARLAPAVRDYGKSQEDALRVTQLVAKAQAIQGADIREQLAATIQFSQGIASGVVRGDELRSLLESSPQLMRYIAQNFEVSTGKIGVAFSQLRSLGEEGKLTADKILDALVRAQPAIERDFVNAPKTAQQGWKILTDQVTRAVGQLAIASGAQSGLVDWLGQLADKADAFRQKMLLDSSALDPLKQAGEFIGDAVGMLGQVGKVGVENFDLLVQAGQAVIALKLGEVFANWFATAAERMRAFSGSMAQFQAQSRFAAGATMAPAAADAARGLRSVALAAEVRASELAAQAEIKLAQATAARTAAYNAANQVNRLKIAGHAQAAAVVAAEAHATNLSTAAKRAEEQASKAVAAAKGAAAAASTRNAMALQAEAVVTQNVTRAVIAKSAAMRVANGLYAAMGGGIGVATLAIGGLIYAVWRSEQAYRAQVQAQHDALVVSDDLARITQAMTSATWSQVPALLAQAQAIRDSAAAARQEAEAQLRLAQARRDAINAKVEQGQLDPENPYATLQAGGRAERDVAALQTNLQAAKSDDFKAQSESQRQSLVALTLEASNIQRQLSSGKDAAGRSINSGQRAQLEARRKELFKIGQQRVDQSQREITEQQAAIERSTGSQKAEFTSGLKLHSNVFDAAAELVATADKDRGGVLPKPTDKPKAVRVPGPVNSALEELTRQEYLPKGGKGRFSLSGGMIQDGSGKGVFTARSEDEAAAAAKYVKQLEAINAATDSQIAKTGHSRQALREAASAMLNHAVETSKATQADERWAEIRSEMTGESRAVIKAEREINDIIAAGAAVTEEAAAAYIAYVQARERARQAREAMQLAEPEARRAFDQVTAGMVTPTDRRGVVDVEAATRQISGAREAILIESERRIRAELGKLRDADGLSREDYERRLTAALAANRLAVESVLQEQLLDLEKGRLQESAAYAEQRYQETADLIIGPLRELSAGGDAAEIGKRFMDDLLQAMSDELIFSPLRQAIIDTLRATFAAGTSGGGGSGVSSFLMNVASAFLGNMGGAGSSTYVSDLNTMPTFGGGSKGNPPYILSFGDPLRRAAGGMIHGPGGPRDDKVAAWLSNGEFVVNAESTRRFLPWLLAMNGDGRTPAFANGGPVGGVRGGAPFGDVSVQINNYGEPTNAEVSRGGNGDLKIDLMPVAKPMVTGVMSSRDGARALKRAPFGPTKRG